MPIPVSPNLLSPESSGCHSPKSPGTEEQFASWLNVSTFSEQRVWLRLRTVLPHLTAKQTKGDKRGTSSQLLAPEHPRLTVPAPSTHTKQPYFPAGFLLFSPCHPRGWLATSEGQGTRRKSERAKHMRRARLRPQRTRLPSEVCCSAGGREGVLMPVWQVWTSDAVAEASDWKLDKIWPHRGSLTPAPALIFYFFSIAVKKTQQKSRVSTTLSIVSVQFSMLSRCTYCATARRCTRPCSPARGPGQPPFHFL